MITIAKSKLRVRSPCKCLQCPESAPREDGAGLVCETLKEACNGSCGECMSWVCEKILNKKKKAKRGNVE
ncbi:hypothetical protein SBF1_50055 [Candidatus Desulfosporosinus infrequens]|uniref:Uncharacterized protein n=1 Tax=Candidatus Desulfosporosinus infrequens TaxID=2043169 RepID=A0A2U3LGT2_9FIRM|nr:hypothetical protein SBF1_50055 [Candidatus Desulfosporosinus infrequens]